LFTPSRYQSDSPQNRIAIASDQSKQTPRQNTAARFVKIDPTLRFGDVKLAAPHENGNKRAVDECLELLVKVFLTPRFLRNLPHKPAEKSARYMACNFSNR
jgi:hypothetical protein